MRQRRGHPLFLIDIAVPRDIDPAVNELEDVYVYDIDALSAIAEDGRRERERQLALCEQLIEEQLLIVEQRQKLFAESKTILTEAKDELNRRRKLTIADFIAEKAQLKINFEEK